MDGEIRVSAKQALGALSVVLVLIVAFVVLNLPPVTVVAGPFVLGGGIGLYLSGGMLRRSRERGAFEPVEATVLRSELRTEESSAHGTTETTYFPRIEYEYTVDGDAYTSDSVYPGRFGGTSDHSREQSVVDDHPEGDRVEAYYHPDDPSRSFLVDESNASTATVGLLVSAGIAAVGVYLLLRGFA